MADEPENGSDDDSDGDGSKSPQSKIPLDFGAIEAAVNEAAKRLNAVWVTFILLMTYLFIATGKITHKDLFLETPVKLPVLGVDVPLLGYFVVAPVFVLALHSYFLIQLRGLAAKFREYGAVLSEVPEPSRSHAERLRHRIDNSLFAQILGGPRAAANFFLRLVAVLTAAVFPLSLLLLVQLTFLAHQEQTITIIHRAFVGVETVFVAMTIAPMFNAWRPSEPEAKEPKIWPRVRRELSVRLRGMWDNKILSLTLFFVSGLVFVSWFVALLPNEPSLYANITRALFQADADPVRQGPSFWFSNRLVLPDQNLIEGFDPDKVKVTRSLRGRHFVGAIFDRADLRQVDFTGADLSFASLQSAKLDKAQFGCATLQFGCTQLQDANLVLAEMHNALFKGANMMGASLSFAKLDGASFDDAKLQGAWLDRADLGGANLSYAGLDGALLFDASLIATDLSNAHLRGTDFSSAQMFGALLVGTLAQDASFENAQMQGASLQGANFNGAKFSKTSVYGTDVSGARLKGALIEKDVSALRQWLVYYGYWFSDAVYFDGDPFGKEGDVDRSDAGYYDTSTPVAPVEIPAAEQDRLAALFPGQPPESVAAEIKKRLARLAPDSKTVDWTKLADKPSTEAEYIARLGERLILIACAQAGEGHVARGLIRSQRLCPYKTKVEAVLNSGFMLDGKACADVQRFKQIWNEAMAGSACKPNAGRP